MKKEITIDDFSLHLFWDVDLSDFNFENHAGFFAQRVIEYGKINDWKLLKLL